MYKKLRHNKLNYYHINSSKIVYWKIIQHFKRGLTLKNRVQAMNNIMLNLFAVSM